MMTMVILTLSMGAVIYSIQAIKQIKC